DNFIVYNIVLLIGVYFFFFQAEDGIRDGHVTGVQTCALPISMRSPRPIASTVYVTHDQVEAMGLGDRIVVMEHGKVRQVGTPQRSEERRVGKECRSRGARDHEKKKREHR